MKDKDYEQLATKIMMNALEGVKVQIRKAYDKGYKDGKADTPFTDTEEAENKAYNRGLNEAWDAAKKIHDGQIPYEVFGLDKTGNGFTYASPLNWGETITAQETIAKIKEYEDKQKQDAEIKVGDEVVRHIAVLNKMLENMDVYDSIQPTTERKKAIKAAIKALEQEPCDAISRKAVIKGIEELKKSPWATANRSHGYEYLITEALDVVKDLCVKQLPSVTQKSAESEDKTE